MLLKDATCDSTRANQREFWEQPEKNSVVLESTAIGRLAQKAVPILAVLQQD